MRVYPEALLAGRRGRRACLEFALANGAAEELRQLIFFAAHRVQISRGDAVSTFGWGERSALPNPTLHDIAAALTAVALPPSDASFAALAASVDSAMYWQEPDGTDVLLSDAQLHEPLGRIARQLAAAPGVAWWASPSASEHYRVRFAMPAGATSNPLSTGETLERWRDERDAGEKMAVLERPVDPTASWGGQWWSTPAGVPSSTRVVDDGGPVGLRLVEDSFGATEATVSRVACDEAPRVLEITEAEVWAELCRAHPIDVTASSRHDWYRATGRNGEWVIPDWSTVARDFDAVHLSVAAYLSLAGEIIAVDSERATVIVGWNPDETYWLTDSVRDIETATWMLDERSGDWAKALR